MTILLFGMALGFIGSLAAAEFIVGRGDAKTIELLTADRDLARHEANVLRGILCPVLNRKPSEAAQGEPAPAKPAAQADAHPAGRGTPSPGMMRTGKQRISFRRAFNTARMLTNSKQRKTDALATAIDKAKASTQEKTHV